MGDISWIEIHQHVCGTLPHEHSSSLCPPSWSSQESCSYGKHQLRPWQGYSPRPAIRLRCVGALHLRQDHGAPPQEPPPNIRQQLQRRNRATPGRRAQTRYRGTDRSAAINQLPPSRPSSTQPLQVSKVVDGHGLSRTTRLDRFRSAHMPTRTRLLESTHHCWVLMLGSTHTTCNTRTERLSTSVLSGM